MASRRTFTLSSRGFWAITLAFLAIEATILSLAYRRHTDQRQLAEQVALVRESTTVVWQMAANADIVTAAHFPDSPDIADPRHTWLNSVLQGLRVGGQVHTLNNTITQLVPVGTDDARQTLTAINRSLLEELAQARQTVDGAQPPDSSANDATPDPTAHDGPATFPGRQPPGFENTYLKST